MNRQLKKQCQVCGNIFDIKDLYPVALIRNNVFNLAQKKYPALSFEGFICFPDLQKVSAMHFEEILKQERGALTKLEKEVLQSLEEHEIFSENINEEFEEALTFGERLADKIAKFGGSWIFISFFLFVLFSWMGINSFQFFQKQPFDPYPYILLNLVLSCLAAIQAPIIMMSQNRQVSKDRLSQENDYQVNLKAELHIRHLNSRLDHFMKHLWQKMHEIVRVQEEILQELEEKKTK